MSTSKCLKEDSSFNIQQFDNLYFYVENIAIYYYHAEKLE